MSSLHPPLILRWLLCRIVDNVDHDTLVGDLDELYGMYAADNSRFKANIWYLHQFLKVLPTAFSSMLSHKRFVFLTDLKVAYRRLSKSKTHTAINITGLSISFAIFLLIILFVQHELSYDTFHHNAQQIYRVNQDMGKVDSAEKSSRVPLRVGPYMEKEFSEIRNSVRFYRADNIGLSSNGKVFAEKNFIFADSTVLEVFDFELLHGDKNLVLSKPENVLLTEETAIKYFGEENPLGQSITLSYSHSDRRIVLTVSGIVKKAPSNSHIKFDFLASFSAWGLLRGRDTKAVTKSDEPGWIWTNPDYDTYIHLQDGIPPDAFQEKLKKFVKQHYPPELKDDVRLSLIPLTDIHMKSDRAEMFPQGAKRTTIYSLLATAFAILLIASINFINFSASKSFMHFKETGIRKAVGARNVHIIKQYITESALVNVISLVLAFLAAIFLLPYFNTIAGTELSLNLFTNLPLLLFVGFIIGCIIFFSGFFPAFFLSSYKPASALRGASVKFKKNFYYRRLLVVIQFSISIVLICSTLFISRQLDFLHTAHLGFNKENLLYIEVPMNATSKQYSGFKNSIQGLSDVKGITTTFKKPGISVSDMIVRPEGAPEGKAIPLSYIYTDENFPEVFEIELLKGETTVSENSREVTFLINESAANIFCWKKPIGKKIYQVNNGAVHGRRIETATVKAVIRDFHFESLYNKIGPVIVALYPEVTNGWGYLVLRIKSENLSYTLKNIHERWNQNYADSPFSFSFLDENINEQYFLDQKLREILTYLTVFSILIACLGLFGLVTFLAQQRTKEIGIRKALGASVSDVHLLLSKEFVLLVVLSNFVAWPISYFSLKNWIQNFAYAIDLNYSVFLVSGIVAVLIAGATVSYQALKTARTNPVNSLRYE